MYFVRVDDGSVVFMLSSPLDNDVTRLSFDTTNDLASPPSADPKRPSSLAYSGNVVCYTGASKVYWGLCESSLTLFRYSMGEPAMRALQRIKSPLSYTSPVAAAPDANWLYVVWRDSPGTRVALGRYSVTAVKNAQPAVVSSRTPETVAVCTDPPSNASLPPLPLLEGGGGLICSDSTVEAFDLAYPASVCDLCVDSGVVYLAAGEKGVYKLEAGQASLAHASPAFKVVARKGVVYCLGTAGVHRLQNGYKEHVIAGKYSDLHIASTGPLLLLDDSRVLTEVYNVDMEGEAIQRSSPACGACTTTNLECEKKYNYLWFSVWFTVALACMAAMGTLLYKTKSGA